MQSHNQGERIVVKVGGSLYGLADLGARLRNWLASKDFEAVLIVPGGGALADAVRSLDTNHNLGEEAVHWLALRALTVAAHFLAALLPDARLVDHPDEWRCGELAVLDPFAFARRDQGKMGELPHCWSVTSDSIAAHVAHVATAKRLVLLKSVTIPVGMDWKEAARRGWVDAYFADAVGAGLAVETINLRNYQPEAQARAG